MFTLGVAHKKFGAEIEKQQEVVMSLSDLFMETFAMESVFLRSRKIATTEKRGAENICAVFLRDAIARMQAASQNVISACAEGSDLDRHVATLRSHASYAPVNAIALRRAIAERLLSTERYCF
jgi:predicted ArsR family transcriptional regulator